MDALDSIMPFGDLNTLTNETSSVPSKKAQHPSAIADVTGEAPATTQVSINASKFSPGHHDAISIKEIIPFENIERLSRAAKYADDLGNIEKNTRTEIKSVESKANTRQALALVRGTISAVGPDIEEQTRGKISEIKEKADREEKLLFIEAKQELFHGQQEEIHGIVDQYTQRGLISTDDLARCNASLLEINGQENQLLEHLDLEASKKTTSTAGLSKFCEKILRLDSRRMEAIAPLAEGSIDQKLTELKTTSDQLKTILSQKNKFITQQQQKKCRTEFQQDQDYFFVAQATSSEATYKAAFEIADSLQQRIDVLQSSLQRLKTVAASVVPQDREEVSQAITQQKQVLQHLTTAQQAYRQIAADAFLVSQPAPHAMQSTEKDSSFGLDLLTQLSTAPENFPEDHWLVGKGGKIKLIPPAKTLPEDQSRNSYRDGINITRLAIFRDCGAQALQRFDEEFHANITASAPLSVKSLKEFIASENENKGFYLSSVHTLSALATAEALPYEDEQLVKAEPALFSLSSTAEHEELPVVSKSEQRKATLKSVGEAVRDFFKDFSEDEKRVINKHFNDQFNAGDTSQPLTVKNVRSFLKKEREQLNTQIPDSLRPFLYSLTWQSGVACVWGATNTAYFRSLGPAPMVALVLGLGVAHDMTSYWRQMRPAEE